jgi:hypothetical protein
MKASEVLSTALERWGQGGENWIVSELDWDGKTCLIGGLSKAAFGVATYLNKARDGRPHKTALRKAMIHVFDELDARGFSSYQRQSVLTNDYNLDHELYHFNDTTNFPTMRQVVCGALKRALKAEEAEEVSRESQ